MARIQSFEESLRFPVLYNAPEMKKQNAIGQPADLPDILCHEQDWRTGIPLRFQLVLEVHR